MKQIKSILFSGIFVFVYLTSGACITSNINNTGEIRNLDDFNEITLAMAANVILVQGKEFMVKVEASDNDLSEIITKVEDNKLIIKNKDWSDFNGKVSVYVTMPEVDGLSVTGSGSITSDSPVSSGSINLNVSGSGTINIDDLSSDDIHAVVTGSGNISISGNKQGRNLGLTITGSGNFNGENIRAENVNVTVTGSGSAKVHASGQLNTNITGSGSVHYKGNPMVNANSTGSGKTRAM